MLALIMVKFFITTAIDYVNAEPHLGHALEKIQADVLARYHRLLGEDVFFLTGTDEHGVKVVKTADQKKHWPSVNKIWLKLKEKGDIYKKEYQGLYCSGCEAFITKKDLKHGKCVIHQKEPEAIEEENYFFKLSRNSKEIEKAIQEDKIKIIPETRKNEIL